MAVLALLFVYIYSPPFLLMPFGPVKLIAVLGLVYIAIFKRNLMFNFLRIREVQISILCYLLGLLYAFGIDGMNDWTTFRSYSMLLFLVEVIPCSLFLSILITEGPFKDNSSILRFVLAVAALQGVAATGLFYFPSWNYQLNGEMLRHGEATELSMFRYDYADYRGYGISGNYFFSMPVFQSVGVLCCMVLAIRRSYLYTVAILPILAAIVLNARVGLVTGAIAVLGIVAYAVVKETWRKGLCLLCFALTLLCCAYGFVAYETEKADSRFLKNSNWLKRSAQDATAPEVVAEFWIAPHNIWLGDGHDIFLDVDDLGRNSDNGYVQSLFYGGLVFSLFLYGGFLALVVGAYRATVEKSAKAMVIVLLAMVVVGNVKGDLLGNSNETVRGAFLLLIFYILNRATVRTRKGCWQDRVHPPQGREEEITNQATALRVQHPAPAMQP